MTAEGSGDLAKTILAREPAIRLGGLEVRPATLEVQAGEVRKQLEPRVMQVLVALAALRGQVVTRDQLNQACWGGRIVSEEALSRCILRLRRLAGDLGGFDIETIPRVGYRLTERSEEVRPRRTGRSGLWMLLMLVGVLLALGVGLSLRSDGRDGLENPRVEVAAFTSQAGDPATTALAAALTSEAMGVLHESRIQATAPRRLSLRPPTYQLGGVVRSVGADVFVRVWLQDAATGTTLWSTEFARPKARTETLASDVAWRAASVMATAISVQREEGGRVDPVALGMHLTVRDGLLSANPTAVRDTVQRAPDFAWGHVALSIYLMNRAGGASTNELEAYRRAAIAEAETAIRLNPRVPGYPVLADALPARAWAAREKILRDGARASSSPRSESEVAGFLADAGRPREAFEIVWRLERSTRYQIGHAVLLPYLVYLAGNGAAAMEQAEQTSRIRPHDQGAAYTRWLIIALAGPPEALTAVLSDPLGRPKLRPEAVLALTAFAAARRSALEQDRAAAATAVVAAHSARALPTGHAVLLLAKLGANDAALGLAAAHAADPRTLRLAVETSFLFAPETSALRADPRFIPIVEQLGLADYWRASGRWPEFCKAEPSSVCARLRDTPGGRVSPAAAG